MQRPERARRGATSTALGRRLLVAVVFAAVTCAAAMDVTAASLYAEAGLDGVCRPGRWMPVRVTLESTTEDLDGHIVAEWGGAVVRHAITLTAPARKQLDLHLRTGQVGEIVTVRFIPISGSTVTVDVPVRVAQDAETVTVCVTDSSSLALPAGCTATLLPEALPRSTRGYDAADHVVAGDAGTRLAFDQRQALTQWQSIRALEIAGTFTAVPELPTLLPSIMRNNSSLSRPIVVGTVLYLAGLGGLIVIVPRVRTPTVYGGVAVGLLIVLACAAAVSAGRAGPGSAIVLHHVSVVQQLPDIDVALVSMRAVAVFPSYDAYVLRAGLTDGALTPEGNGAQTVDAFDEHGVPVISQRYGLGARQPLTVEAVTDIRPFEVSRRGRLVRITHVSELPLHDCRLAPGSPVEVATELVRGVPVEFELPEDGPPVLVTCASTAIPVAFTSDGREVITTGTTRVSVVQSDAGQSRP